MVAPRGAFNLGHTVKFGSSNGGNEQMGGQKCKKKKEGKTII